MNCQYKAVVDLSLFLKNIKVSHGAELVVNIAGSRESQAPGIRERVGQIVAGILGGEKDDIAKRE